MNIIIMSLNFSLFNLLPFDIINHIESYLRFDQKGLTKVLFWKQYYKNKINQIDFKFPNNNTYIRFIIVKNLWYILENYILLINPNILRKWKKMKYWYQKRKYKNYIAFLKWYSRKNNSINCLYLILALENDIKNRNIIRLHNTFDRRRIWNKKNVDYLKTDKPHSSGFDTLKKVEYTTEELPNNVKMVHVNNFLTERKYDEQKYTLSLPPKKLRARKISLMSEILQSQR